MAPKNPTLDTGLGGGPAEPKSGVPIDTILKIVLAVFQYGFPAVQTAIGNWFGANDVDPTPEDVDKILEGLKPPEEY